MVLWHHFLLHYTPSLCLFVTDESCTHITSPSESKYLSMLVPLLQRTVVISSFRLPPPAKNTHSSGQEPAEANQQAKDVYVEKTASHKGTCSIPVLKQCTFIIESGGTWKTQAYSSRHCRHDFSHFPISKVIPRFFFRPALGWTARCTFTLALIFSEWLSFLWRESILKGCTKEADQGY